MITVVTVLAFVIIARALVRRIDAGPYERAAYILTVAALLWLGSVWILALLHLLTRPLLIARTVVAVIWSAVAMRPLSERRHGRRTPELIPIALWVLFVLVRAAIVPPLSHDALAYHLPKAVLYMRAHGFEYFPFLNSQIRGIPANYEILLADTLTLENSDTISEWVSTYFYIAFVVACVALAERWWKRGLAAMAIASASLPVVLLHAGAHKNDLMVAAFAVAGIVASGRFFSTGSGLLIAATSFAAAIGTKPQIAIVAIAVLPFLARKLRRELIVAVAAFFVLGGAVYVANLTHRTNASDVAIGTPIPYGDWSNLWQAPYVLITAPFSPDPLALHVPWTDAPWFWRRYELYFSHLGVPFAICLVLFPIGMFVYARNATKEAIVMTIATTAALLVILPTHFDPHGMFTISLPRYMLFFVPVVFAWTIVPFARWQPAILGALCAFFLWYAVDFTINDRFDPWRYVVWAAHHRGTRVVPFDPYRAACVLDRAAGPRDRVAVDAAFGSWIYPAFGRDLERSVEFIQQGRIPDDAQWVIVDRGFQAVWQHPDFRDLSQARQFLLRGQPTADDLRVVQMLLADSRFKTVFYNRATNQAVFRRIQ